MNKEQPTNAEPSVPAGGGAEPPRQSGLEWSELPNAGALAAKSKATWEQAKQDAIAAPDPKSLSRAGKFARRHAEAEQEQAPDKPARKARGNGKAAEPKERAAAMPEIPQSAWPGAAEPPGVAPKKKTQRTKAAAKAAEAEPAVQAATATAPAAPVLPPGPAPTPENMVVLQQFHERQATLELLTQVGPHLAASKQQEELRHDVKTPATPAKGAGVENTIEAGPTVEIARKEAKTPMPEASKGVGVRNPVAVPEIAPEQTTGQKPALLARVVGWAGSIGKSAQPKGAVGIAAEAPAPAASAIQPPVVPEAVAMRFLKVDNGYYFHDKSPAFIDQGRKLATRGEHPEVIRSLVEIAKAREWHDITVKGTEAFRRGAWMEATQAGIKVAGYTPTELDLAELQRKRMGNSIEQGAEQVRAAGPSLVKQPDPALREKATAFEHGKPSEVLAKHPDLADAYALISAARAFAKEHLPDHEDKFVAIGRRMVIDQLARGEKVVGPKIHDEPLRQQGAEQGKPPRAKAVAQER